MFDDTLVICGGEFGRTIPQGKLTKDNTVRPPWPVFYHLDRSRTAGHEHSKTDDYSYNILEDPVHIRD